MAIECKQFPPDPTLDMTFYVTNVIFTPLVFGVGIVGTILSMIIFNRKYLRVQSPIYVYLSGLAIMDFLSLVLTAPSCGRDMNVLKPEITYSQLAVHITTHTRIARHIFNHSSIWIVACVVIVRYSEVTSRSIRSRPRFARISSSRIMVFTIFMICALINFARFFEVQIVEFVGHCYSSVTMWYWEESAFGKQLRDGKIYLFVVAAVCYALPYFLILLFLTIFALRARILGKNSVQLSLDKNEIETNILLIVLVIVFTSLKLLDFVLVIMGCLGQLDMGQKIYRDLVLVADFLCLVPAALNFIIYMGTSSEFRRTFTRTFCCGYLIGDEYVEPFSCCRKPVAKTKEKQTKEKANEKKPTEKNKHTLPFVEKFKKSKQPGHDTNANTRPPKRQRYQQNIVRNSRGSTESSQLSDSRESSKRGYDPQNDFEAEPVLPVVTRSGWL